MTEETRPRQSFLPRTPLGWGGTVLGVVYFLFGIGFSQGLIPGSDAWLPWVTTFVLGTAAIVLCVMAWRRGDRATLIVTAGVLAAFWWLQYAILLVVGFFTGGLFAGNG